MKKLLYWAPFLWIALTILVPVVYAWIPPCSYCTDPNRFPTPSQGFFMWIMVRISQVFFITP